MKKRYEWLDVMKLLGVFFVYVVHYEETGRFGLFFLNILLGVLFFASGFSASAHEHLAPIAFIKTKLKRLMLPYLSFSLITLCVRVLVFELSLGEIIDWVRRLTLGVRNQVPIAAIWFLPCLFCMMIYYYGLKKIVKNRFALLAVCFLLSAAMKMIHEGPALPWGAEIAVRFLIYYALGDFVHGVITAKKVRIGTVSKKLILFVFLGANLFVLYTHFYFGQMYFPSLLGITELSYPVKSLLQFLYECNGIICVGALSMLLQAVPGLCKAGRYTLEFCCAEQLAKILVPLVFEVCGLTMFETGGVYVLIHAAIMMLAAYYGIILPMNRYFPWMLGKMQKRKEEQK